MLKNLAIAALLVAFLFGWPCVAEDHQSHSGHVQRNDNRSSYPVLPTHVVVDQLPAVKADQSPKTDNSQYNAQEKPLPRFLRPEWVIVHITAVYVAIAGITLWAIWRQARVMERQALSLRRRTTHLRRSVIFARKAAKAAETSAKAAMGLALPVLVLQELTFENHDGSYAGLFEYPVFKIVVRNFGQSPAFLKSYAVVLATGDLPDEPTYPKEFWPLDMHEVVDAGQPYTLSEGRASTNDRPSEETQSALIARRDSPIVYGFITYGDVFGSAIHTMKFSKIFFEINADGSDTLTMDWGGPNYTGQQDERKSN